MEPTESIYGSEWRTEPRLFGPYGEYLPYSRSDRGPYAYEAGYRARLGGAGGAGSGYWRQHQRGGEHVWHGGVLGWLGSGLRAYTAWIGNQMQSWGSLLGGKVKGTSEDLARAMRGRGEQVGSAMEHRGDELMRSPGSRGRPSRSYRRPDDRILDDVHLRIAWSGVDADDVEVEVNDGIVTLSGRVSSRFEKSVLEEIADQVFGVQEVQNQLRLARRVEERTPPETRSSGNGQSELYRPGAPS